MRALLVLCSLAVCVLGQDEIDTVDELVLEKYLGRWYQTHGNRLGWLNYGDQANCNTADYIRFNDTTITLINANRQITPDGDFRAIGGRAWRYDPEGNPGKLYLQIDGVPFVGDYWVVKLGPAGFGEDGLYEYSIVSGPTRESLYVLARDVTEFEQKYEAEVLQFLEEEGFTGYFTRPIKTPYHGPRCIYAELP